MTNHTRDIADYVKQYQSLPFEPIQIEYRRKLVMAQIRQHAPRRMLEIGCGERPLFLDFPDCAATVLEPAAAFAQNARALAAGRSDVEVVQDYIERYQAPRGQFDLIVASCVLHEVPDAQAMLAAIAALCDQNTVVHINVPNAMSLHRVLAYTMGLIDSPAQTSGTQRTMQQRDAPYSMDSLAQELQRAGFSVTARGSLFVKPFTHAQMQHLVDTGFMGKNMLDGLDGLTRFLPDMGSEIWVNLQLAH